MHNFALKLLAVSSSLLVSLPLLGQEEGFDPITPGKFHHMVPVDQVAKALLLFLTILGAVIGVAGLTALVAIWRPSRIRKSDQMLRRRPFLSFVVGVLVVGILIGGLVLAQIFPEAIGGLLGLAIILAAFILVSFGATTVSHAVGDRMLASLNSRFTGSSVASVLCGTLLVLMTSFLLVAGQILQLILLCLGFGAWILSLFSRQPISVTTTPDVD